MFRSNAIIIHKQKIRDGQTRIILFTRDFGRVTGWEKKPQSPDVWSIVEVSIERNWSQNTIKNFDIRTSISQEFWKYEEALWFLYILQTLYDLLPESSPHTSIFDDVTDMIKMLSTQVGKLQLFLLIHMRILKKLWSLRDELFLYDKILNYIYINIDSKNIQSILNSKPLEESSLQSIQTSIFEARHRILHGI